MMAILIIATISSGLTAALQHHRALIWRRRCRSLENQNGINLQTIFDLQQQLQNTGHE